MGNETSTDTSAKPDASLRRSEVAPNFACARCQYNLTGLNVGSNCPECGLPIDATLRVGLDRSDPVWVSHLTGAATVSIFTVALSALHQLSIVLNPTWTSVGLPVIDEIGPYVADMIVLAVLFTAAEPGRAFPEHRFSARRMLRGLAGLVAAAYVFYFVTEASPRGPRMTLQLVQVALTVAYLIYWRQLARRAGDAFLVRQIPFAVGGNLFFGIGAFLFWWFVYPARGMRGGEDKLIAAGFAFFVAYECYLLIWFRAVLLNAAREAIRHTRLPIDPRPSREDSTSP